MNIKHEFLIVPKTARYSVIGEITNHTKYIWVVLHGYGHLSTYFISKFKSIVHEDTVVVAPEGLHRFYLNGTNGRVGASWMTKEQREEDIKDYINYLEILIEKLTNKLNHSSFKLIALGFSQGGATATRWAMKTKFKISAFVLWASVFPNDMNPELFYGHFKMYFIIGDEDEYLSQQDVNDFIKSNSDKGVSLNVITFKGKHTIPENVLVNFSHQLKTEINSHEN